MLELVFDICISLVLCGVGYGFMDGDRVIVVDGISVVCNFKRYRIVRGNVNSLSKRGVRLFFEIF